MVAQWKTPGPPRQTRIKIQCPICNTPDYSEAVLSAHLWTKHGNRNLLISTVIQLTSQLIGLSDSLHRQATAHNSRYCILCEKQRQAELAKQTASEAVA